MAAGATEAPVERVKGAMMIIYVMSRSF